MFKIFYNGEYCCGLGGGYQIIYLGAYISLNSFGFGVLDLDGNISSGSDGELSEVFGLSSNYGGGTKNRCFHRGNGRRKVGRKCFEDYIGVFGCDLKGSVMFLDQL